MNDYDIYKISNECARAGINKFVDSLKYINIDLPHDKKVDIYSKIQRLIDRELEDMRNESKW